MNQKADVPVKLREVLSFYTIREKTIDNMGIYVEDYLDPSRQMLLLEKLTAIAHKDCISIETNVETGANTKIILILLTDLLLKAISKVI